MAFRTHYPDSDFTPFPTDDYGLSLGSSEEELESLSASPSAGSTASSSSAPSPSSSSEQASTHQASPPVNYHDYYGGLPPSPLPRYYQNPYPQNPMVQTRTSLIAQEIPPVPPSSRSAVNNFRNSRTPQQPTIQRQPPLPAPVPALSTRRPPVRPTPTIYLTSSSPAEARSAFTSNQHARKKRRTVDTPTISLDDDDDDETDSYDEDQGPPMQQKEKLPPLEEKPKKLAGTACIICMEDEPVDLSITPCGHMFCNKCLYGAIKATLASPHKVHGKCPVCRGKVSIKDIVVLEIKKLSKGKERAHG